MTAKLLTSSLVAIKYHCYMYKTRISALSHFFINQVFYRTGISGHGPPLPESANFTM